MKYNGKDLGSPIYVTIALLGPVGWMILGIFDANPSSKQVFIIITGVVSLFVIGYVWGRRSQEVIILELSREIDELSMRRERHH